MPDASSASLRCHNLNRVDVEQSAGLTRLERPRTLDPRCARLSVHTTKSKELVESRPGVYAIVRSGGRQHKVAVGDVLEVDRFEGAVGSTVSMTPLLLVDGDAVTSDASALGSASVTAEVVAETKGPKIRILKFKNKTGYRKRQGHRQRYTKIKVTDIKS